MLTPLEDLASAIATQEGFFSSDPNVLPRRNNNPGNLRYPLIKKFRKFSTAQEGTAWLYFQITLMVRRGLTLRELIKAWAPPSENDSARYLAETVRRTGINPDMKLWTLLPLERKP